MTWRERVRLMLALLRGRVELVAELDEGMVRQLEGIDKVTNPDAKIWGMERRFQVWVPVVGEVQNQPFVSVQPVGFRADDGVFGGRKVTVLRW